MFKSFFDNQSAAMDKSLGDSLDSQALFVEVESYESLRAKAELKDQAMRKLLGRVKARDQRLKEAADGIQETNRQVLVLKKDLAEVVEENARVKTRCEELQLERDGLDEVNSELHKAVASL